MAPQDPTRLRLLERVEIPPHSRRGSVLALLYPHLHKTRVLLTKRASTLASHRGQISFPGGSIEELESPDLAALRETEEEVGIEPSSITLIGSLSELYIPVSGFWVSPFVGYCSERPSFRPDPLEVESLIEAPLAALDDPRSRRSESRQWKGQSTTIPFYAVEGEKIWGATAMILAELLELCAGLDPRT